MLGNRPSEHAPHFDPILYGRAEPDDLYDPPETADPYLIDQEDEDLELDDFEALDEDED